MTFEILSNVDIFHTELLEDKLIETFTTFSSYKSTNNAERGLDTTRTPGPVLISAR